MSRDNEYWAYLTKPGAPLPAKVREWREKKRAENAVFNANIDAEREKVLGIFRDAMNKVAGLDTAGVPEFSHDGRLPLREDVVTPGLTRPEALANAPDTFDGHFRVPTAIPPETK